MGAHLSIVVARTPTKVYKLTPMLAGNFRSLFPGPATTGVGGGTRTETGLRGLIPIPGVKRGGCQTEEGEKRD